MTKRKITIAPYDIAPIYRVLREFEFLVWWEVLSHRNNDTGIADVTINHIHSHFPDKSRSTLLRALDTIEEKKAFKRIHDRTRGRFRNRTTYSFPCLEVKPSEVSKPSSDVTPSEVPDNSLSNET